MQSLLKTKKKIVKHINIHALLHDLCGGTPEETINILITVFCLALEEAIAFKITMDELDNDASNEFIYRAFGASMRSHEQAREEMLDQYAI